MKIEFTFQVADNWLYSDIKLIRQGDLRTPSCSLYSGFHLKSQKSDATSWLVYIDSVDCESNFFPLLNSESKQQRKWTENKYLVGRIATTHFRPWFISVPFFVCKWSYTNFCFQTSICAELLVFCVVVKFALWWKYVGSRISLQCAFTFLV